ncbi:MAG: nitroreductase family protein [Promethearchaeota archaeon]|jgi:nitroreductase
MYLNKIIETWKNPLNFKPKSKVRKEDILKIIEAGRWSPSADNQQVWRFMVIDDLESKDVVIKSILAGDPRLTTTLQEIKKPILKSSFIFSPENFNAKTDKYRDSIHRNRVTDENCAYSASFFILCMHKSTRIGKMFGFVDIGSAITNIVLISYDLGFHTRLIRNFDREIIKKDLNLPQSIIIDTIIAIGKADKLDDLVEYKSKNFKDFYLYNLWDENLTEEYLSSKKPSIQNYNIEVRDAILDRRSIRNYDVSKLISKNIISEIMKSGMMIPLVLGGEPYVKFIIIDSDLQLKKIAKTARIVIRQSHVQKVLLIVVATYDCSNNSPGFYAEVDTGSIIQNMLLRAHTLGVGSCWIGAFNRKVVRKILNVPEDWHIPSMAIFGYPNKYPKPTPRLDLGKICYYNSWENNIEKRRRTPLPDYHVLSVGFRKLRKTRVQSILRSRKVGDLKGIPEFEKLIKSNDFE